MEMSESGKEQSQTSSVPRPVQEFNRGVGKLSQSINTFLMSCSLTGRQLLGVEERPLNALIDGVVSEAGKMVETIRNPQPSPPEEPAQQTTGEK